MASIPHRTRTEEFLLQPIRDGVLRGVGLVCGLIGLVLVASLCYFEYLVLTLPPRPSRAWVIMAVFGALAAFFLTLGYRFGMRRPNRYGSAFSPRAWVLLCGIFVVLAVTVSWLSIRAGDYQHLDSLAAAWWLALLSYGAASHFSSKFKR